MMYDNKLSSPNLDGLCPKVGQRPSSQFLFKKELFWIHRSRIVPIETKVIFFWNIT